MAEREERRRAGHVRLPLRVPVMVELKDPPAEIPIVGVTENLSRGGLLLRVSRAFRPGTALQVTLYLRRSSSLATTGTVAWFAPDPDPPGWKQGFQFTKELSEPLVAHILGDASTSGEARSQ